MRKFYALILPLLFALGIAGSAQNGSTVTVFGDNVTDSTGTLLASGTIRFTPTDCKGHVISYRIAAKGQAVDTPVSTTVTNGIFSIDLADTEYTSPLHVCFATTITDNVTGNSVLGPGYSTVQPSSNFAAGGAGFGWCAIDSGTLRNICNFDAYPPNNPMIPITTVGSSAFNGGPVANATTFGSTVTLNADPTANLQAATKQYVDAHSSGAFNGGAVTNPITLPADPTANLQAATKQYVDAHAGAVSPATSAAFGTVKLASGQTGTTLAKVATTNNAQDLANFAITVAPQNRLAGSITAAAAPDNLQGDRAAIDFRSNGSATPLSSVFDTVGGGTPTLAGGIASGTFFASRSILGGSVTSWTIQCNAYYTSSAFVACGGVTSGGSPVLYGAGFNGAGPFGWWDATSTFHSVTTPTTANVWYTLTTVVDNGYSTVSICPSGSDTGCVTAVAQATGAPAVGTVQAQTGPGFVYNFKYATANVSGSSPTFTNVVAVPSGIGRGVSEILPVNLQVPSNPSGSSVNLVVTLPPSYKPGTNVPWVMWFHGHGGFASDPFTMPLGPPMSNALLNAGYAIVSSDYSQQNCWGDANCVADIQSAVTQAKTQFNLDPVPYCYAGSMGGIVLFNAIAHGAIQCRAIEAIFPVTNLASIYQGGSGTYAGDIQTDYGFGSSSGYSAATVGYDPNLDPISDFVNIPTEIHCSAADTVVPCSTNGQAFASAITAAGGTANFISSTGDHGDPSNVQPAAAIDWFRQH